MDSTRDSYGSGEASRGSRMPGAYTRAQRPEEKFMGVKLRRNASMVPGPPAVRSVKGDYLSLSGNHPILKTLSKQGKQGRLQSSQGEASKPRPHVATLRRPSSQAQPFFDDELLQGVPDINEGGFGAEHEKQRHSMGPCGWCMEPEPCKFGSRCECLVWTPRRERSSGLS